MGKHLKRLLAVFCALVTAVSICIMPASAVTSAEFSANRYCEVNISQKLLDKKGTQYASVKVKTYSRGGQFNNSAKIVVTLKDNKNRVIWKGQMRGGDTLKLGDDHKVYRIYVSPYNEPAKNNIWSKTITGGSNFENLGKCYKWVVTDAKNCSTK